LPSATWQALSKGFTEGHVSTRQRLTAGSRKALLDGSLSSATQGGARQRFFFKKKFFAECHPGWRSAKIIYLFLKNSLPSATWLALDKAGNHSHIVHSFAECLHSAKLGFYFFQFFVVFFNQFTLDKYDNIHNICNRTHVTYSHKSTHASINGHKSAYTIVHILI
jgi:hypothetical protein